VTGELQKARSVQYVCPSATERGLELCSHWHRRASKVAGESSVRWSRQAGAWHERVSRKQNGRGEARTYASMTLASRWQ
jgi:hypothetical protein